MEYNDFQLLRIYNCASRVGCANRSYEFEKITKEDVLHALKINNFNCFYCNDKINPKNWQLDHFHPKSSSGNNNRNNLVACCKWCNTMKNALDGNSFINKCKQIVQNNFFEINGIGEKPKDKMTNVVFKKIKRKLLKYDISEEDLLKIKNILN